MKKVLFLFLMLITLSRLCNAQYASCTPTSCPDPENNGELNPDSLATGTIGVPYNYVLSVLPPPSGSGFTVTKIKIVQIDNMPAGFSWQTNSNNSNDYLYSNNWYCVVINGTPNGPAGVYNMTIWANAWIQTWIGEISAPGNPQNGGTLKAVVCNPINLDLGPDTSITTSQNLVLNATNPAYASYSWNTGATSSSLLVDGNTLAPGVYTYWVTVSDSTGTSNGTHWPYCSKTDTIRVTVTLPTGDSPVQENTFSIHPNPATDFVNIVFTSKDSQPVFVELLSIDGKAVFSQSCSENEIRIDVSKFPSGFYMIKAQNYRNTTVMKLLLK